jgi:hypothetical protein
LISIITIAAPRQDFTDVPIAELEKQGLPEPAHAAQRMAERYEIGE